MSRLSRRTMVKGSLAAAGFAAISHVPGADLIRAQNASYDIVSFGPISEGVMAEGFFWPQMGAVQGMHASGTAFGQIATSTEKFTPCLFNADGSTTRLKSGQYGGRVTGMNSSGTVIGAAYDTIDGQGERFTTLEQPVAWIDGELVRLPVPDPVSPSADLVGSTRSISEDGVIFGVGNGHTLRWVNGEPEILPDRMGDDSVSYRGILPNGSMVVLLSSSSNQRRLAVMNGDSLKDLDASEGVVDSFFMTFVGANSESAALIYSLYVTSYTGAYVVNALRPGEETVVIDPFEDGISFRPSGFNAANQMAGSVQLRDGLDFTPAIWEAGEFTMLEDLLPADHGFHMLTLSGISDDGVLAGSGWDEDGAFHPLLFVPA